MFTFGEDEVLQLINKENKLYEYEFIWLLLHQDH